MNGYTYPPQQHQQHSQHSSISGGINPSMLQGGHSPSQMNPVGAQAQMHGNPAATQFARQQAQMGGMGGMNAMNGMGGMANMGGLGNMNGMNGMGGMGGMTNMNAMNGMAGGMGGGLGGAGMVGANSMNMGGGGRMNNLDFMNQFNKPGGTGGGGGMDGMNVGVGVGGVNGGMNFDSVNPAMLGSSPSMGGQNSGMGMGSAMNPQDLQKMILQRQAQASMNMGRMGNMGGMGGMNMAGAAGMNGMGQGMNQMGMGMMGGNPAGMQNFVGMQQPQLHQHQNQSHIQSPHSTPASSSSGNPYPSFAPQQSASMPPPPPRPSTAMSTSSHTSASQHPGPAGPMGSMVSTPGGIPRPPTAAGQHPNAMQQQMHNQFPGGHSAGHQISRPGTAAGMPPQSAGEAPPRTPQLGSQGPSPASAQYTREMSRPPSRPQTAGSNAGSANVPPHTPVQAHSPSAVRSMSQGPVSNGMSMNDVNAINMMGGGQNMMNGKYPPGSGPGPGSAGSAMNVSGGGGPAPGMMMMPPNISRQSFGGSQASPIQQSHPPHTPHTPQHGSLPGPSTPTPLSAGGRMRTMSSGGEGHDGSFSMGMGMGGMPTPDSTGNAAGNMGMPGGMGMQNGMMPGMNMPGGPGGGGVPGSGMNQMQLQQMQEMQQRKAMAQNEMMKQQAALRVQQQQQQQQQLAQQQQHQQSQMHAQSAGSASTPGISSAGSMIGSVGAEGLGIGMGPGQNQSPASISAGPVGGGMPNIHVNNAQHPLGTPTRPSTMGAQMDGTPGAPQSVSATPGRTSISAGIAGQAGVTPSSGGSTGTAINGAVPGPTAATPGTSSSAGPQTQATPAPVPELPPMPTNVHLNPKTSRVSIVPMSESAEKIPPLSKEEIEQVKEWQATDKAYEGRLVTMINRYKSELAQGPVGLRSKWWERDMVPLQPGVAARRKDKFDLHYPLAAPMHAGRKQRGKKREGLKIPGRLKDVDAERGEQLVPIRLEFDVEHHKYRDTFVWNLNDPIVTPEAFAQSIVDDYGLPSSYHSTITKSIEEQLSDFKLHSATLGDGDEDTKSSDIPKGTLCKGGLEGDEEAWWARWRAGLRNENGRIRTKALLRQGLDREVKMRAKKRRKHGGFSSEAASEALSMIETTNLDLEVPDYDENMHEEMRIVIKLDITVGEMKLDDQFEWDIENEDATPEQFAEVYSNDLGLAGEFKTAISHSIREQVSLYQKSLFLVGHPSDGSAVQDDDLRMSFLPSVGPVTRSNDQTQVHQPIINYLSEGELDRLDKEREKEANRRRKRNTRGRRGVALPDREPLKTHRTPAIGFPEIDPQTLALAAAAAAPTSRRAAAAAASLTIANMVASENGTAVIQASASPSAAPSMPSSKIPKAKGSFKAPAYSSSLLKYRVDFTTAIPSTAADSNTFEPPLDGDAPLPPSVIPPAPEPRPSRALTAKRQRELEKEAKEREFADGQRANYINGVWHCSNCGCPDHIAIGRRKGPLGDKSQCGACGKFWHRHRRPRPVEYHADAEYHLNLIRDAERAKTSARKKGGAAALRALAQSHSVDSAATPASDDPSSPPPTRQEVFVEIPSGKKEIPTTPEREDINPMDRALSPASSISSTSASERPLAQMVGMNGAGNGSISRPPSAVVTPLGDSAELPGHMDSISAEPTPTISVPETPHLSAPVVARPEWLEIAFKGMQDLYPDDRFDVIARRPNPNGPPHWRLKCMDCPGKLYNVGPDETLNNFEVHLKNRQHRAKVNARITMAQNDPF